MNPFIVLEISPTASHEEIKNAYKNLIKKYHPDVYKGSDANERVKKINEAYSILKKNKSSHFSNPEHFFRIIPKFSTKMEVFGISSDKPIYLHLLIEDREFLVKLNKGIDYPYTIKIKNNNPEFELTIYS